MTTVRLKIADENPSDTALCLRMDGHAEGSTDACTAISTLVCTLQSYMHNDPEVRISREVVGPGDVNIIAAGGMEFHGVCRAFHMGLLMIEKAYPEYIKVRDF